MNNAFKLPVVVLFATLLFAGAAVAEDSRVISDKWYITAGGFLAELTTEASVGAGSVLGTFIQAEDHLGLDERKSTFRLLVDRRLGERHTLGLEFYKFGRSGSNQLSDAIEFEGNVYAVGAQLSSTFDTQLVQLTYKYAFINDGRNEAGIQAGLSTWKLSAELAGEATIDDGMGGVTRGFVRAGKQVFAPVPSLGLFVRHAFGPRWVFLADARFFRITVGSAEGSLVDTRLSVDYFFSRHVGIGLGVNGSDLSYKRSGDTPVLFEYRLNGAVFYLGVVF